MGRNYIVEEVDSSSGNGSFWIIIAVVILGIIMASSKCTPYQSPSAPGAADTSSQL